ncbi:diversity-generating retroelement protein Avd [Paenibacillus dendritiformis]|uniref:diversity-generating retroelement protein Avd n=1 Tax=Paenibacillus dendritiformis TaxID=130049 RepID=UPI000DA8AEDB|nr:diversity-generating retroelement protein Avd [Paenibacillus dendritiformis]PZM64868.1 diversity-generating retroelement protein Avd [Paenibacillus dendritiformis]
MVHELVIYQKMYDLILHAYPIVNKFPKNQRFTLGQEIQGTMLDIQKNIIQANRQKSKAPVLYQIDTDLEKLKFLIRLAKDLGFIDIKKYETLGKQIAEIGRLLGGWLKKFAR